MTGRPHNIVASGSQEEAGPPQVVLSPAGGGLGAARTRRRSHVERTGRRRLLQGAGLGGLVLLLAGCGFQLRQPVELGIRHLALSGFSARSSMAAALRRALPPSVTEVPAPAGAEVVVQALEDRFERTVAASTAAGQVREFRLRVSLKFRLTRADGVVLLGDTLLEQQRDMSYTETAALAKEAEQAVLVDDMRDDIARQLLRMLSALGRPAG